MKKCNNETVSVEITDMNNLGHGIARCGGKVMFVQHGVDGDKADVQIIKHTSGYDIARIERLTEPSQYRAPDSCAASRICGGCVYSGITYEHELELKRRIVESEFRKAGLSDVSVSATVSAGKCTGYRNKIQLPVGRDKNGKTVMGYYAKRSHDIIPCTGCGLSSPHVSGIDEYVRLYIESAGWAEVRHLYMRCGTDSSGTVRVSVCLVVRSRPDGAEAFARELTERFPQVRGVLLNYNAEDTNVILGKRYETLTGEADIVDCICGLDFRISPASFYQVNRDAAELAYKIIAEKAALKPGDRLLDLYCGIGTIGLCTASMCSGISLTGIEIVPEAVENAKMNAAANGFTTATLSDIENGERGKEGYISKAAFACMDAKDIGIGIYDVIIVDPPRKGCSEELIEKLDEFSRGGAERIVYMSCNPATLARDAALLYKKGFVIDGDAVPIDMFPRTGHVETVAVFSKK